MFLYMAILKNYNIGGGKEEWKRNCVENIW
jgi:hypothetical protein